MDGCGHWQFPALSAVLVPRGRSPDNTSMGVGASIAGAAGASDPLRTAVILRHSLLHHLHSGFARAPAAIFLSYAASAASDHRFSGGVVFGRDEARLNVRFGSKADTCAAASHVRFAPKSGHH